MNLYGFAEDVINGKFLSGELIRLAAERFVRDWDNKKDNGWYFDEKIVDKFIAFTQICNHWKGGKAGTPIILEEWQKFYFGNILGWKKENGLRRFRTTYQQIARKNYKSTSAALLTLFHIIVEDEPGAQAYIAANKEQQATIVVNDAGQIALGSPALKGKLTHYQYKSNIVKLYYPPNKSSIAPIGRDSRTQDGLDCSLAVIDEYHEARSQDLLNILESGQGNRPSAITNIITTSGHNHGGVCYQFRNVCADILRGIKHDDSTFAMIFELDQDDDWHDQSLWIKANPRMIDDPFFMETSLQKRYQQAINEGGQKETDFRCKQLNQWLAVADAFVSDADWQKCNINQVSLSDLKDRDVWIGLDLSAGVDLNAAAIISPRENGIIDAYFKVWMPEDKSKNTSDGVDYQKWIQDGLITPAGEDVIDHTRIAKDLIAITETLKVRAIDYDTRLAHHGVIQNIMNSGFESCRPISQGCSTLGEPVNELERLIVGGLLNHGGNEVARWCCNNMTMYVDTGGLRRPSKTRSNGRIDAMAALVNAIAGYMTDRATKEEEIQIFF